MIHEDVCPPIVPIDNPLAFGVGQLLGFAKFAGLGMHSGSDSPLPTLRVLLDGKGRCGAILPKGLVWDNRLHARIRSTLPLL